MRRGNPLWRGTAVPITVCPGNLPGIATPVCALARNDTSILGDGIKKRRREGDLRRGDGRHGVPSLSGVFKSRGTEYGFMDLLTCSNKKASLPPGEARQEITYLRNPQCSAISASPVHPLRPLKHKYVPLSSTTFRLRRMISGYAGFPSCAILKRKKEPPP